MIVFLRELNRLSLWGADVDDAFLEGKEKEFAEVVWLHGYSASKSEADMCENIDIYKYIDVYAEHLLNADKDPKETVTSKLMRQSSLNKHHYAFAYHRLHEFIAASILGCYWIGEKTNPAGKVNKHWNYPQAWQLFKP